MLRAFFDVLLGIMGIRFFIDVCSYLFKAASLREVFSDWCSSQLCNRRGVAYCCNIFVTNITVPMEYTEPIFNMNFYF